MDLKIAPSLLSANFAKLGDEVKAMEKAGADYFHVDVMDGHFVPNLTFGPMVVKAIRPLTKLPLDVHLMIEPVEPFINEFIEAGADIVTVHAEACTHLHRVLQAIKEKGIKAGVALNPATPIDSILEVLDIVDLILVMSVNPGFGGQKFIESQLNKVKRISRIISEKKLDILLEVDGGVVPENIQSLKEVGANILVAGTAAFKGGESAYRGNISALRGN